MPLLKTVRVPRNIAITALLCGAAWLGARPAEAEVDVDLRAGFYMDAEAFGVGAGLLSPLGSSHKWYFNPNLELAFGDNANLVLLNGDVHYDFADSGNMSFWIGAGPALLMTNPDGGDNDTSLGLNLFTGVTGTRGSVRPFAQFKGVVSDNNEVVLQGGIRF